MKRRNIFFATALVAMLAVAFASTIERDANAVITIATVEDSSAVPILIGQQPGVSLNDSIAALCCPASIDETHAQKVIQFTKSRDSQSEGPSSTTSLAMTTSVYVNQTQALQFQFFDDVSNDATPSLAQRADIESMVKVDGETVGVTRWLGYEGRSPPIPFSTGIITLEDIPEGKHSLTLIPVTRLGGCNTEGWLYAWGGTLVVFGQS